MPEIPNTTPSLHERTWNRHQIMFQITRCCSSQSNLPYVGLRRYKQENKPNDVRANYIHISKYITQRKIKLQ